MDKKYYISEAMLKKIIEKKDAHPDIRWKSGIKGEGRVPFPDDPDKPSRAITQAESGANRMTHGILVDRGKIRETDISTCIDAHYYKGADKHAQRTMIHNIYGGFKEGKPRIFDKHSPTIRTAKGGGHLPSVLYWKNSKEKWVNEERLNLPALKRQTDICRQSLINNKIAIRRLTPKECERLQGFPDGWTEGVSDTQRYKQMGNAVSVPVIESIGKAILKVMER